MPQTAIMIDLNEKLLQVNEYYTPKQIALLNGTSVKVAKFKGPFTWHTHEGEDELFWVIRGTLEIELRDMPSLVATENQIIVIPKGLEHRPHPQEDVFVVLIEPATVLNTGNVVNSFTVRDIEQI